MAKLRHVALHARDPVRTAEFYKRVFDLQEVGRSESPLGWGIYLSDGVVNLAVLKLTDEAADRRDGLGPVLGVHHIGFEVDDVAATRERLTEMGAAPREEDASASETLHFEEKWIGPDGANFDISGEGWPISGG